MNTIQNQIIAANTSAVATAVTTAWNIHSNQFGKNSKVNKAADALIAKHPDCNVFAVCGRKGRSQHSASEVVLLALPRDVELDRVCRQYWMFTA